MIEDKAKGKRWIAVPAILSVLAAGGVVLGLMGVGGISLTAHKIYNQIAMPLLRLLGYLAAGLLAGQVVESLGWTAKLSRWLRPVIRWARMGDASGAAFTTSFISGILANSLLMAAHQDGKISRRELVLAYLLDNGLPMFLVHLPTTFFIVISVAGSAGFVYLVITFLAACVRTGAALVSARLMLPADSRPPAASGEDRMAAREGIAAAIRKKFVDRFKRVVAYTLPIYVLVFLLNDWGLFQWLRAVTARAISTGFFPIEAAGMVVFAFAAEFSSGMAAAGALLDAGTLTAKQGGLALVAGTIVSTPIRAIRHQLPTHAGIFNFGLASELLAISQGLRVLSLVLVALPYAVWF
ncbi:MAG: hypothetical protein LDL33_09260 [Desulfomonile sp.]|nr:hypothetical protein [Desulfomonile sp.]